MQATELREGVSPTKTDKGGQRPTEGMQALACAPTPSTGECSGGRGFSPAVALRRSVSATDASPWQAKSTMRAIGVVLARQARQMAEDTVTTVNDVIDLAPLLRAWKPAPHKAGEVVTYDGAPYSCIQAHDSTGNPDWSPDKTPALWSPYHATDAAHALPWQAPTGAQDAYQRGEWMVWGDKRYKCVAQTTVWGPDVRAEDWREESAAEA